MSRTGRGHLRSVITLTAAVLVLTGCSNDSAGTPTPVATPPTLQQALSMVPASVSQVEITDQAAAMKRWGLADLTGAAFSDESQAGQLKTYIAKSGQSAAGVNLSTYAATMDDWGWNGIDVDWEVRYAADGPPVTIDKLRDDLDMKTVIASLVAHKFTQSGSGDALRFDRPLKEADVPIFISGVTVIPSQHLLVATADKKWAPPAADSSLGSNENVTSLIAGLTSVDYLALSVGPGACVPAIDPARAASPEQIKAIQEQLGKLGTIGGAAAAVLDDQHSRVRTLYADAAAATADLPARQKLLTDGDSLVTRQPYTELFPGTVKADGKFLQYDLTPKMAAYVLRAFTNRDLPWALCS